MCLICVLSRSSVHPAGPGSSEPARRRVHQREAFTEPHPTQDRGDGAPRHPAVRHLSTAAGFPRLRLQNPLPIPGDGFDPARCHRGE